MNTNTLDHLCTVKYPDFAEAIKICAAAGRACYIGCSDVKVAFRNLGIRPLDWCYLVMKAESPLDGITYYFVDKCLAFGVSISCSHFQRVSNAIVHIVRTKNNNSPLVNFLDDYLFSQLLRTACNNQIKMFLKVCSIIGMPESLEKTFWATRFLSFLGFIISSIGNWF